MDISFTHKQFCNMINPPATTPVMPPTLKWAPQLARPIFKWKHLWIKEMPPKIRDILWRGAFNALPSRRRLRYFTATQPECTLCNEPEDGPHMLATCSKLASYWRQIQNLTLYIGVENKKTADILYGIAYQSVYLANIFSRLYSTPHNLLIIRLKFRSMLAYYQQRIPLSITKDWPDPIELTRFIGSTQVANT